MVEPRKNLKLRVTDASSRAKYEADRELRSSQIERALRVLTANLIRIARGAGDPERILRQCQIVQEAYRAYDEDCGGQPENPEVVKMLSVSEEHDFSVPRTGRGIAMAEIISGALQISAARLADQPMHESRGTTQFLHGIEYFVETEIEAARDRRRKERAAQSKPRKTRPKLSRKRTT